MIQLQILVTSVFVIVAGISLQLQRAENTRLVLENASLRTAQKGCNP